MIIDYNPSLPQDKVFLWIRHNKSFCSGNYAKIREYEEFGPLQWS